MTVRQTAAVLSSVLVVGLLPGCGLPGVGGGCSSYQDTQYIPAQTAIVFERDEVSLSVNRDPVRTLTVIVSSSDGAYDQTRVDPHVELMEGIELGTQFGMDWIEPGVRAPGQVRPALRVYDCWELVEGPSDVF